jgi:uncharacterized protein with NRDE domain
MCLILFAYKKHPKYKLIVAANRDEFYERPTASVHFWEDHPHILAGRDLEQMGTWMGVTTQGGFAALTNFRNPNEQRLGKRSRGELAGNFLKDSAQPWEYLQNVAENGDLYPGYNLLTGDRNELFYYSNIGNEIIKLEPGIYGVSNHLLNTDWPKVKKGKDGLEKIIGGNGTEGMEEQLLNLLQNADHALDDELPKTGVSMEMERMLSPMFIKSEGYGTRSSTVLLMSDDFVYFKERVYSKESTKEQKYHFHF